MSTPETPYGRDWFWGDKVRAVYQGRSFVGIGESVHIAVDGRGNETVDARLDAEYFADVERGLDYASSFQPLTATFTAESLTVT